MNKSEFVNYISEKHSCTKIEAEKVIDMFVSSVIDALGAGNEISLVGFGSFSINKVAARTGSNSKYGPSFPDKQFLYWLCCYFESKTTFFISYIGLFLPKTFSLS